MTQAEWIEAHEKWYKENYLDRPDVKYAEPAEYRKHLAEIFPDKYIEKDGIIFIKGNDKQSGCLSKLAMSKNVLNWRNSWKKIR